MKVTNLNHLQAGKSGKVHCREGIDIQTVTGDNDSVNRIRNRIPLGYGRYGDRCHEVRMVL